MDVPLSTRSTSVQLAEGFVIVPFPVPPRIATIAMKTSPLATPAGFVMAILEADPAPKLDAATNVGAGSSFSRDRSAIAVPPGRAWAGGKRSAHRRQVQP